MSTSARPPAATASASPEEAARNTQPSPRKLSTAQCYAGFERVVEQVQQWAARHARGIAGYAPQEVAARLTQCCVELAMTAYMRRCTQRGTPPSLAQERLVCDKVIVQADGALKPTWRACARSVAGFGYFWLTVAAAAWKARRRVASTRRVTIVYAVGRENILNGGSDAVFLEFCRAGPVEALRSADLLAVECSTPLVSTDPERVSYARDPILAALEARGLSHAEFRRFCARHFRVLLEFVVGVLRERAIVLLARDLAEHAAIDTMNRANGLEAVLLTNSNVYVQPLWMRALRERRFSVDVIWYSQNSLPIVCTADPLPAPHPIFRHIVADRMWVWTEGFRAFLWERGCRAEIRVVGPIIWYVPLARPTVQAGRDSIFRIAVFDVTPHRRSFVQEMGWPYNYYEESTAFAFLDGLLDVRRRLQERGSGPVELLLKHKRESEPIHEPRYVTRVRELAAAGDITLMSPQADLYSLIGGADAVVVIPFSSVAHVATSLGKPTLYFDPTRTIIERYPSLIRVDFASGADELLERLSAACASVSHPAVAQGHGP